jgi:hypothetical protein
MRISMQSVLERSRHDIMVLFQRVWGFVEKGASHGHGMNWVILLRGRRFRWTELLAALPLEEELRIA